MVCPQSPSSPDVAPYDFPLILKVYMTMKSSEPVHDIEATTADNAIKDTKEDSRSAPESGSG